MSDVNNLMLRSANSSQKVVKEGSGTLNIPAFTAPGESTGTVTIPHGQSSDNLIWQVASNSGYSSGVILPWESNDGRLLLYSYVDSVNLYIIGLFGSAGVGAEPAQSIDYAYRILIP